MTLRHPVCAAYIYRWRRPIGCLKLHVIFRKRVTNYRALLWKMTYKDKASYDSTPPCVAVSLFLSMCVSIYVQVYVYIYMYAYIHIYTCVCVYIYMYMCMYMYVRMCIHIHITYIYITYLYSYTYIARYVCRYTFSSAYPFAVDLRVWYYNQVLTRLLWDKIKTNPLFASVQLKKCTCITRAWGMWERLRVCTEYAGVAHCQAQQSHGRRRL